MSKQCVKLNTLSTGLDKEEFGWSENFVKSDGCKLTQSQQSFFTHSKCIQRESCMVIYTRAFKITDQLIRCVQFKE